MTRPPVHPLQALFGAREHRPSLPVCDHYAGVEPRMRKALALQSDMSDSALFDVTLDLEDGAPVGGEREHALLAAELVSSAANRHDRVGVRVHPYPHPSFVEDVRTLLAGAGDRLAYLMIPKAQGVDELSDAIAAIESARREQGVGRAIPVHALVETHGALRDVQAIATLPAIESLSFGLMDFVSAHHGAIPAFGMSLSGQFSHPLVLRAKLEISAACHAAGKLPSHCVVTEYSDTQAIAQAATLASRELGYARMWSIHPNQIRPIVEAFAPVPAEIEAALDILLAAQAADWAPIAHRGLLQDRASYRYHWHVLERAARTGRSLPEAARTAFFAGTPSVADR